MSGELKRKRGNRKGNNHLVKERMFQVMTVATLQDVKGLNDGRAQS